MTAVTWDLPGVHRYETGIDRGVLYLPGGGAVPWNGLTSVVETRSREIKSFYMDGVKYLDYSVPGAYSAKLQAYTYPDELEGLIGDRELVPGLTVYEQSATRFNLSYRTKVGNDLVQDDYGYKIHLLYNLTGTQSDATFNTISDTFSGGTFEWTFYGVPNTFPGVIASSHFSVDSLRLDPTHLSNLENYIYGSPSSDPSIPDLSTLVGILGS